ncbi:hypothetical protein Droror1_Dr00008153 [Drosera rotundifolia]
MESKAEAEASSSLGSVSHLRPHADKASIFRHSDEGLQKIKKQKWDMYFPIELITNIIARLPVKTLLRFRCVSTTWHDVIESEYFETMHLDLFGKLQKNTCFLVVIHPENKWSRVVLGYDASKIDYKVVAIHFRKVVVESNKFPALVMVYSLRNRCWRREIVSYNINTGKRFRIIQKADKIHCEYVESLVLLRKKKGTQVSPKQPSQKQEDQDGKVASDAG